MRVVWSGTAQQNVNGNFLNKKRDLFFSNSLFFFSFFWCKIQYIALALSIDNLCTTHIYILSTLQMFGLRDPVCVFSVWCNFVDYI